MLNDTFSDDHLNAIGKLIEAISPSTSIAARHRQDFLESDPEDVGSDSPSALLWLLKEIVDWETGYFVDWKDTESFVQCLTKIASAWGATLTFGVDDALDDDFLDENSVPDLMIRAHAELLAQRLVLWNWNTEGDCYSGWLTKVEDKSVVASISELMDLDVAEGDEPF